MQMNWKRPEFDENFFDPKKKSLGAYGFIYNRAEMIYMIADYLDWFKLPICRQAIHLLQATITFRGDTSPSMLTSEYITEAQHKAAFDDIAKKIQQAQTTLESLDATSSEYRFFSLAIRYCLESIRQRIEEVQKTQNSIYNKYYKNSLLQNILEKQITVETH